MNTTIDIHKQQEDLSSRREGGVGLAMFGFLNLVAFCIMMLINDHSMSVSIEREIASMIFLFLGSVGITAYVIYLLGEGKNTKKRP